MAIFPRRRNALLEDIDRFNAGAPLGGPVGQDPGSSMPDFDSLAPWPENPVPLMGASPPRFNILKAIQEANPPQPVYESPGDQSNDQPTLEQQPPYQDQGPRRPTYLETLEAQRSEMDAPPRLRNRILQAIIPAAGIALGGIFGGAAGATGAAQGATEAMGQQRAIEEARRKTLLGEIEAERNRQERGQERQAMLSGTLAGQKAESERAGATLAEQIRHNKAVETEVAPHTITTASGEVYQYDPIRKTWSPVTAGEAQGGAPISTKTTNVDVYTPAAGEAPLGITITTGDRKVHITDPTQMTPEQRKLFEAAQGAYEQKSWKDVDPIIRAQIGERPRQQAGQSAQDYQQTLAEWGKKAEDIKVKMITDPAVARAVAFGMNRPVLVYDAATGLTFYQTAGEAIKGGVPAAAGTKDIRPRTAIMNDMQASIEQVKNHTKVLNGGIVHRTLINSLLSSPDPTAAKDALVSRFAQQLTPDEEDFVTMLLTAREQVFGLRKTLTGAGGGSDEQARQILNTLPGTRTPTSRMANKQIDQALAVLGRLRKTIPDLEGAPRPPNAPAGAAGLSAVSSG